MSRQKNPQDDLRVFMVGGAVRDRLLGRRTHDRDWVVVGSTPEGMLRRGFVPVGRDFPVFLHPHTHEEYALARTERKSGRGHQGFVVHAAPSVTLEEDLARRDLRINAMAAPRDWNGDAAHVIDPLGGLDDLRARRLRHASAAFAEDPLRILRVARFAATFGDFSLAPETLQLMRSMVTAGELHTLAPERIWQEFSRALLLGQRPGETPSRMLMVLHQCGALASLLPEIDYLWSIHREKIQILMDKIFSKKELSCAERYACLIQTLDTRQSTALAERLRLPGDCRELAALLAHERQALSRCQQMDATTTMDLLRRCDALRRGERFAALLRAGAGLACLDDARAAAHPWPAAQHLHGALRAARSVDSAAVAARAAARGLRGAEVGDLIHAARVQALAQWQAQQG